MSPACRPHASYRTLLAFDLILEADGTPLLLEINPYPGLEPQSAWHGQLLARVVDDYVGACVGDGAAPPPSTDRARPALDGRYVHEYADDGWALLIGTGRAGVGAGEGECPAYGTVPCGARLVRKEGFVG